ncbi:MAG: hypothetical protein RL376_839 [Verrucomicrobiota bacterium]|jgi:hypothetical protein
MNKFLHITKVAYLHDYKLELGFNDGTLGEFDFENELAGEIYKPLINKEFFSKVYINPDTETIEWPNGADFAPEYIHSKMRVLV